MRSTIISRWSDFEWSDSGCLVLIGRMLIIRPIRHILRGVFFDRTSDKYRFKIRPYLKLLGGPYFDGFDFVRGACEVWQPHRNALRQARAQLPRLCLPRGGACMVDLMSPEPSRHL